MKNITIDQLHSLVSEAYAVDVNDTLYFVGYDDEDCPYVADNNNEDKIDLSEVDGDIEVTENGYFFYVQENPVLLKILNITLPK